MLTLTEYTVAMNESEAATNVGFTQVRAERIARAWHELGERGMKVYEVTRVIVEIKKEKPTEYATDQTTDHGDIRKTKFAAFGSWS